MEQCFYMWIRILFESFMHEHVGTHANVWARWQCDTHSDPGFKLFNWSSVGRGNTQRNPATRQQRKWRGLTASKYGYKHFFANVIWGKKCFKIFNQASRIHTMHFGEKRWMFFLFTRKVFRPPLTSEFTLLGIHIVWTFQVILEPWKENLFKDQKARLCKMLISGKVCTITKYFVLNVCSKWEQRIVFNYLRTSGASTHTVHQCYLWLNRKPQTLKCNDSGPTKASSGTCFFFLKKGTNIHVHD